MKPVLLRCNSVPNVNGGDCLIDRTAQLWNPARGANRLGEVLKHERPLIQRSSVPMVNGW